MNKISITLEHYKVRALMLVRKIEPHHPLAYALVCLCVSVILCLITGSSLPAVIAGTITVISVLVGLILIILDI